MKYGFTVPGRGPMSSPEALAKLAKHGEDLGYDSLFIGDHIAVPRTIGSPYPYTEGGEFPGADSGESLEQLTTLAYLAGRTEKIRLVTSVLIVPHRNPILAAKALATLDVLSGGRLVVGVGVGWMREEFEALGLPPFEERGAVTDEYIRAFKELWTSDDPEFQGKYCSFSNITFLPKPVQKPHPPIWVGGESRPALRRTAELADGWYPLGSNPTYPMAEPEQMRSAIQRMGEYARGFGRDPANIEISYRAQQLVVDKSGVSSGDNRRPFTGNGEQIAGDIRTYEAMGVSRMVLDFIRQTESLDEVLRRMDDLANEVWTKF